MSFSENQGPAGERNLELEATILLLKHARIVTTDPELATALDQIGCNLITEFRDPVFTTSANLRRVRRQLDDLLELNDYVHATSSAGKSEKM